MLFTSCCDQMDSVFELYMETKTTKEMSGEGVAEGVCQYTSWKKRIWTRRVFEYLEQAVSNTFDRTRMPTILLALTQYFSRWTRWMGGYGTVKDHDLPAFGGRTGISVYQRAVKAYSGARGHHG